MPGSAGSAYLAPGTLLKQRYEIESEIGRGGYSVVYAARDRELDSRVAIKLLVPPPAEAHIARERMRREVRAVRGISHPNIVAVHDFLEQGSWSFVVMEYIDGPDLAARVRDSGPLEARQVAAIGHEIAGALAAAHGRGILHRDVKPQNILLDLDGRARLTDFGSARLAGQSTMTRTGGLVGTIKYAAPEVVAGARGDARTDVYALGLTLFFALTGDLPESASPHLPSAPAPAGYRASRRIGELPAWIDDAIACSTCELPGDRFATAQAMADALERKRAVSVASSLAAAPARVTCLLCGAPDPLGLPVCPRCGGTDTTVADTLIFVRLPIIAAGRREVRDRLTELLSERCEAQEIALVAAGCRALVRVPGSGAGSVIEELKAREIPARATRARRAWASMPLRFWGLLAAIVVSGGLAGALVLPSLTVVSPMFALLLTLLAQRHLRTPVVEADERSPQLPPLVQSRVIQTVAALPPGPARGLLADVVRMARVLYDALPKTGDPEEVREELDRLLTWACDAARDIAVLDENLERLEDQSVSTKLPSGWMETLSRTERVHDRLVQRLLELISMLGRMRSNSAAILTSGEELEGLAIDIEEHFAAHAEAVREIKELLGAR